MKENKNEVKFETQKEFEQQTARRTKGVINSITDSSGWLVIIVFIVAIGGIFIEVFIESKFARVCGGTLLVFLLVFSAVGFVLYKKRQRESSINTIDLTE